MNVSEYITKFFIEKNIRHIFGFQGGAILKIVDDMVSSGKVEYIQNYHEQASSFAADAYSRVSDVIGVAMATSGPGATNLINGIANAYLDSIPCLFITGQYYSNKLRAGEDIRSNGFQDLDIVSMVKPITKYAVTVTDPKKIKYELEKCYHIAKSGRPGSVLIDIPLDIQFSQIDESELIKFDEKNVESLSDDETKIDEFISLLKSSKRPVILSGGGIRSAKAIKDLTEFAEHNNIPVVCTLNGLDSYAESFGFVGLYGNTHSNLAVYNADLLIVLGARLGQHQVGKSKDVYTKAKVAHIDIDQNELGRAISEDISIKMDAQKFLKSVNKKIGSEKIGEYKNWHSKLEEWKNKYQFNSRSEGVLANPVKLVNDISSILDNDAIVVSDVGQNQMWVAQGIKIKNQQRILNSSGFGSMGYSLPAAIGAKIANPDSQIISFAGDGGFQMNIQELLLVSQRKMNIKIFILNNKTLGMTRDIQKLYYKENYYGSTPEYYNCVDIKMIAEAYKISYTRLDQNYNLENIQKILKENGPHIFELEIDADAKLLTRAFDLEIFKSEVIND